MPTFDANSSTFQRRAISSCAPSLARSRSLDPITRPASPLTSRLAARSSPQDVHQHNIPQCCPPSPPLHAGIARKTVGLSVSEQTEVSLLHFRGRGDAFNPHPSSALDDSSKFDMTIGGKSKAPRIGSLKARRKHAFGPSAGRTLQNNPEGGFRSDSPSRISRQRSSRNSTQISRSCVRNYCPYESHDKTQIDDARRPDARRSRAAACQKAVPGRALLIPTDQGWRLPRPPAGLPTGLREPAAGLLAALLRGF